MIKTLLPFPSDDPAWKTPRAKVWISLERVRFNTTYFQHFEVIFLSSGKPLSRPSCYPSVSYFPANWATIQHKILENTLATILYRLGAVKSAEINGISTEICGGGEISHQYRDIPVLSVQLGSLTRVVWAGDMVRLTLSRSPSEGAEGPLLVRVVPATVCSESCQAPCRNS